MPRTNINLKDLQLILHAAFKMAIADKKLFPAEQELLKNWIRLSGLTLAQEAHFRALAASGSEPNLSTLSSEEAKRLCLLALTAMALSDEEKAVGELEGLATYAKDLRLAPLPLDLARRQEYIDLANRLFSA